MMNKQKTVVDKSDLERMLKQVKQQLKPKSKNELIRIISALLLDNHTLKSQLDSVMDKIEEHNTKVDEINAEIAKKQAELQLQNQEKDNSQNDPTQA